MSDQIKRQLARDILKEFEKDVFEALKVRNKAYEKALNALNALPATELTCDGCKYNVGGMLYQPCTECARSAVDNWIAEEEE